MRFLILCLMFQSLPCLSAQVVNTRWGTINLATYSRPGCNCTMCQEIRALQRQYRAGNTFQVVEKVYQPETIQRAKTETVGQEACPEEVVDRALELLRLFPRDVFADIGCGDGRVLIRAVEDYGCSAVGVEIDRDKASEARRHVLKAVREGKIPEGSVLVITADAEDFNPAEYGVTAAFAYLYPETLGKIRQVLSSIPIVVTPYHEVPGLNQTPHDDIYVYRKPSASIGSEGFWDPLGSTAVNQELVPVESTTFFEEEQNEALPTVQSDPVYDIGDFMLLGYSTDWCGYCKSWERTELPSLKRAGVRYKSINIDRNNDHQFDSVYSNRRLGNSVPVYRLQVYDRFKKEWRLCKRQMRTENELSTANEYIEWRKPVPSAAVLREIQYQVRRENEALQNRSGSYSN